MCLGFFKVMISFLSFAFIGLIVDKTENYTSMFYFAGAPLVTASFLILALRLARKSKCTRKERVNVNKHKDNVYVVYDIQEKDHLVQKISVL